MVQFCHLRLYLGIETVSCRLLLGMAGMAWTENCAQFFQVSMLCRQKITQKNYGLYSLFDIFFITLAKTLRTGSVTERTGKKTSS